MDIKKLLEEHSFEGSYISEWEFYTVDEQNFKGLNIKGDFGGAENSEFKHFRMFFGYIEGLDENFAKDFIKGKILKSIDITDDGEEHRMNICIADNTEYNIKFKCRSCDASLYRYLGLCYDNVYYTADYKKEKDKYRYVLDEKYFIGQKEYDLPDEYSLLVKRYNHTENNRCYSHMERCYIRKDYEVIFEYETFFGYHVRSFSEFIEHSSGHRYYPFRVDMYGICYFDIDTHETFIYVPKGYDSVSGGCYGESFIITDIHYDKSSDLIAYGGCYWAGLSDVMIGDFSKPLNFDPHLVSIHDIIDPEWDNYDDDIDFVSWDENTITVKAYDAGKNIAVDKKEILNKIKTG